MLLVFLLADKSFPDVVGLSDCFDPDASSIERFFFLSDSFEVLAEFNKSTFFSLSLFSNFPKAFSAFYLKFNVDND